MITRYRLCFCLLLAAGITVSCERVPLLAPAGSAITLIASATALPVNGSTVITAQVIEPSGTPPHSGTFVSFTTTLGSIQPEQVETDISGRAIARFLAGTGSGTATITAISGGSSVGSNGALKILIGTAAVGRVSVTANPTLVPALGGVTTISAVIIDINGNPLAAAPVSFSTTAGTLADAVVNADQNGLAQTTLRTSTAATVTASVGAQAPPSTGGGTGGGGGTTTPPATGGAAGQASGTVTVGIASSPTLVITPPTTPPSSGLPASFTFAVTAAANNASAVRDVVVNWGDGQTQDLGAITGSSIVSHVYRSSGSYSITATVTDTSGNVVTVTSFVTVLPPALTLAITPPATAPSANLPANFTFTPTVPAGDAVRDVTVNWGDGGAVQDLGAIAAATIVSHVFRAAGNYVVSATIVDIGDNRSSVSTSVSVIPIPQPTIVITPSPVPGHAGTQTTLTIQVTLPAGVSVQNLSIDFGDGQIASLGGAASASVPHVYTAAGTYTVKVTVTDTTGQTTVGTTAVSISGT